MAKLQDPRPRLTFEQANALCREFLPIGDHVFDYMAELGKAGFEAFLPRHRFTESFALNREELEVHRRCVGETAKERLGRPWPMHLSEENLKERYFSPFLQRLRAERDHANGGPENQLSSRYSQSETAWRRELDPCRQRMLQMEINQRETYEVRFTTMLEEEMRALEDECSLHATGLGREPHTFDSKGRYAFFIAVMERDAASLGFHYDRAKSRPNYPVFSKAITKDWHLCWVIEDAQLFFHSPFEGLFAPYLELRGHNLCGKLAKAKSGEFLKIRYTIAVPSFFNGYWMFFNLDQLETAIRAHLRLYGLIAPIIEGGIRKVLDTGKARLSGPSGFASGTPIDY
jgi:hypothetical protein